MGQRTVDGPGDEHRDRVNLVGVTLDRPGGTGNSFATTRSEQPPSPRPWNGWSKTLTRRSASPTSLPTGPDQQPTYARNSKSSSALLRLTTALRSGRQRYDHAARQQMSHLASVRARRLRASERIYSSSGQRMNSSHTYRTGSGPASRRAAWTLRRCSTVISSGGSSG